MNILITGASRGIGKALALEYASPSNNIFITARNSDNLKQTAELINKKGGTCSYETCDSSDINDVKNTVGKAFHKLGNIDIAILNAGVAIRGDFSDFNVDYVRRTYDVNFFGVLNFIEFLLPEMKKAKQGVIAPVSSLADARGYPKSGSYSSSKAALTRMLESARIELKREGIDIITVRPGFVKTDMTDMNDFKMPFLMDVERAANIIKQGIERKKAYIDFPFQTAFLSWLIARIPNRFYEYIMGKSSF